METQIDHRRDRMLNRATRILTIFRRIGLIPMWALTLCMKPFLPQSHPWKHQNMNLRSWWLKGTREAVLMGWVFWLYIPTLPLVIRHLFK